MKFDFSKVKDFFMNKWAAIGAGLGFVVTAVLGGNVWEVLFTTVLAAAAASAIFHRRNGRDGTGSGGNGGLDKDEF